jgi:hypothetical protein
MKVKIRALLPGTLASLSPLSLLTLAGGLILPSFTWPVTLLFIHRNVYTVAWVWLLMTSQVATVAAVVFGSRLYGCEPTSWKPTFKRANFLVYIPFHTEGLWIIHFPLYPVHAAFVHLLERIFK